MTIRALLLGTIAGTALAPAAMAERGSDGEVKVIYWQAPVNHDALSVRWYERSRGRIIGA